MFKKPYEQAVIDNVLKWMDARLFPLVKSGDVVFAKLHDFNNSVEIITVDEDGFAYRLFVHQNGIGVPDRYMINSLNDNNGEWIYER